MNKYDEIINKNNGIIYSRKLKEYNMDRYIKCPKLDIDLLFMEVFSHTIVYIKQRLDDFKNNSYNKYKDENAEIIKGR